MRSGPGRIRTCDRPVMLPSYSFRCPFRVCGLDCLFTPRLRGPAVQSLHLPQVTGLGSGLPCPMTKAPPNLTGFRLVITLQTAHAAQIVLSEGHLRDSACCIVCGTPPTGRQTRFCSPTCKNQHHQSYDAQKSRGLSRKLELVTALGGTCAICGYNKNLAALTFHHTDPTMKSFKLDMRTLSNRTYQAVLAEIDKCILVCHNCHAELHHPHLNLDLLP